MIREDSVIAELYITDETNETNGIREKSSQSNQRNRASIMGQEFAFLLWLLILIVLFFILRSYNITWWSSLVFSLVVAWIILCLVYPFQIQNGVYISHPTDKLVALISIVTIVILIIYIIQRVFTDREDPHHHYKKDC